jgi:hypothetical protein
MGRRFTVGYRLSTIALVLALVSPVRAQDRMRQIPPAQTELVSHPDWILTPEGKERIDDTVARMDRELFQLRVENSSLRADVTEMAAKPALTWKAVALFVGVGLVTGVTVGVLVSR